MDRRPPLILERPNLTASLGLALPRRRAARHAPNKSPGTPRSRVGVVVCWLGLVAAVAADPAAVHACPFCDPRAATAGPAQSMALAEVTVAAKVVGRHIAPAGDAANTKVLATFEVTGRITGEAAGVTVGGRVTLTNPRGAIGEARVCVLMLAHDPQRGVVLVDAYPDSSGALAVYLTEAATINKLDFAKRLTFSTAHLESPVPEIADDAYKQFVDLPFETLIEHRDRLPRQRLRQWLAAEGVDARRKGLYGLMLGVAAGPRWPTLADLVHPSAAQIADTPEQRAVDLALLRQTLNSPAVRDIPVAAGGVMAGLCLVDGDPVGIVNGVLDDPNTPAGVREGVAQVLRFLYEQAESAARRAGVANPGNKAPPKAIGDLWPLWRRALANREVAPLVIHELANLQEFALTEDIKAYWADPKRLTPAGRLAVFAYQKALPPQPRAAFKQWLAEHSSAPMGP